VSAPSDGIDTTTSSVTTPAWRLPSSSWRPAIRVAHARHQRERLRRQV